MKKSVFLSISIIFTLVFLSILLFVSCSSGDGTSVYEFPAGTTEVELPDGSVFEVTTPVPINITVITDTTNLPGGSKITLVSLEGDLRQGDKITLSFTNDAGFGTDYSIAYINNGKWETVTCTLSSDGKTLSAEVDHLSIWCVIDVSEIVKIQVTPSNVSLAKGTIQQFTATAIYIDNTTQDISTIVSWTTDPTDVATITAGGLATGIAEGVTTIRAMHGSTGIYGEAILIIFSPVPANLLVNGDFEAGSAGNPDNWSTDAWNSEWAYFSWSSGVGYNLSRGVVIDCPEANDANWQQQVSGLVPGKWYNVYAWVKGDNVEGGKGINLCVMDTWESSKGLLGTFEWTRLEHSFPVPSDTSGNLTVGCRLGYWGAISSGTAYFDDISLKDEYSPLIIGSHINFMLESNDINSINSTNFECWRNRLDEAYETYQDLVGIVPFNGQNITITSVRQYPGGWAIAGNPIKWMRKYIPGELLKIQNNDDWSFGILHEISHNFDLDNWNFHGEFFANFKMYYVVLTLNASVSPGGQYYTGAELKDFHEAALNQAKAEGQATNMGGFIYRLILISEQFGWDAFKQTFRSYTENPSTDVEKFDLFLDKLSLYSESDVRDMIPQDELEWLYNDLGGSM